MAGDPAQLPVSPVLISDWAGLIPEPRVPLPEPDPTPAKEIVEPAQSSEVKKGIHSPRFASAIATTLKTRFSQEQKDTINHLIRAIENEGIKNQNAIAYIFATAWHESGFKSIREIRAKEGTQIRKWQDRYWPSGFYGRGASQLTWKKNYEKFSKLLGLDLVRNPDLVLDPGVGAPILVMGMARGLFSGVALSKYFPDGGEVDPIGARKIVNGTFQADKVADKYLKILSAISSLS